MRRGRPSRVLARPGRFLGRGEEIRLDAHEFPEFVERAEFRRFVPVVERVPANDVVVA